MFGYVRAFPAELKLCEWEAYRGVYCGLCRRLGRRFGPFARLTLSYDFTFLAVLGMALDERKPIFCRRSCGINPLRRCLHCEPNGRLDACCDIAALTLWYKLEDNIADGGFFTRMGMHLLRPLLRGPYRIAQKAYPALDEIFAGEMRHQRKLEAARTGSIDAACEPTARMMEAVLGSLSEKEEERRVLMRMGYLLGRYIYMADALDDREKDAKSGSYNPFLVSGGSPEQAVQRATDSLYLTIGELGTTYELLPTQHFSPILDNIIHLGLRAAADELRIPRKQRRKQNR